LVSASAPRGPDGFHGLATIYQTLELFDVVTVTAKAAESTAIRLTSNDARVPTDNHNTAWKMVELALKMLGRTAEVEIHIEKRLPVQGGLGAGSANAAVAALVGLEAELGIADFPPFEHETLRRVGTLRHLEIAAHVGSDVPLFLIGGTVLGVGSGTASLPAGRTSSRSGAWWLCRRSASRPHRPFATGTRSAPPKV